MLWRIGQISAVISILVLIVTGVVWPQIALPVFWNVIVPLVPISLLVAPAIWRGICPFASANTATNGLLAARQMTAESRPYLQAISLSLLFLLIPARRFLLNENGLVLSVLLAALLVLALVVGSVFRSKAGFCNSICPVLPVEKLYGQHPILTFENFRCKTCDLCTAKGCFDLGPERAATLAVGDRTQGRRWLTSGFGIFALAFPGLIFGYFQVANVPLANALEVYLTCFGFSIASYLLLSGFFAATGIKMRAGLPILAAIALSLYYWYAPITMAETLGMDVVFVNLVRLSMGATIVYWFYTVIRSNRRLGERMNHHDEFYPAPVHMDSATV